VCVYAIFFGVLIHVGQNRKGVLIRKRRRQLYELTFPCGLGDGYTNGERTVHGVLKEVFATEKPAFLSLPPNALNAAFGAQTHKKL